MINCYMFHNCTSLIGLKRGNLNTRKRKLDEDDKYDCLILAKAGLDRMGWTDRISSVGISLTVL